MRRAMSGTVLDDGLERLGALLGSGFEITSTASEPALGSADGPMDATVVIRELGGNGVYVDALVDAVSDLSPAQAERAFRPRAELMRRLQRREVLLVVAPWLSRRTREALISLGINYLDLTGNVRLDIDRPRVMLRLDGAEKRPASGSPAGKGSLAGPRAARLVRWLVDVRPPYRVTRLAEATELSVGYVSRLLDAIEDLGLLQRDGRRVVGVDWAGLLQERAAVAPLLRTTQVTPMLAPLGPQLVVESLTDSDGDLVALTGGAAAADVAPLTVGGTLMAYVDTPAAAAALGRRLGLLPTDEGANVLLLVPSDPVVFARRRSVHGVPHVALSQLALDCLSGPDRLPAVGEAVLVYMRETEERWRIADRQGD